MPSKEQKLNAVEARIGYTFVDKSLLWEALQAAGSGVTRAGGRTVTEGNYRLAVVGDSALDFVLAAQWFRTCGSRADWSDARQTVLCNVNLADIGRKAGLHVNYCLNPHNPLEPSTKQVATLVEAIIGAVCEDSEWNLSHVRSIMKVLGLTLPVKEEPVDYIKVVLQILGAVVLMIWTYLAWMFSKQPTAIPAFVWNMTALRTKTNNTFTGPLAAT